MSSTTKSHSKNRQTMRDVLQKPSGKNKADEAEDNLERLRQHQYQNECMLQALKAIYEAEKNISPMCCFYEKTFFSDWLKELRQMSYKLEELLAKDFDNEIF